MTATYRRQRSIFSDAELFSETERFLVGYDGDYYYIKVVPHHIISDEDESTSDEAVNEARRYDFVLCRGDDELYTLLTADRGAYSFNSFAAIYDGYVYYPDESELTRRGLTRVRSPRSYIRTMRRTSGSPRIYCRSRMSGTADFICTRRRQSLRSRARIYSEIARDGVYVRDNDGAIFRISHDGGSVNETAHRYSETERYFVSGVDGKFKYVSRDGYGVVE